MSVFSQIDAIRRRVPPTLLLLLPMLLALMLLVPKARASDPSLSFLDEEVSISPDENGVFVETVTIRNDGEGVTPEFVALVDGETLTPAADPPDLKGYSATEVKLTFEDLKPTETLSGTLVVHFEGYAPGIVPLTLTPKAPPPRLWNAIDVGADEIVRVSFAAAAIFFAFLIVSLMPNVKENIGEIGWDFEKNWASTIVAVTTILGLLLGKSILPEEPQLLTEVSFSTLNQVFLLLIVLAPLVGVATSALGKEEVETHAISFVAAGAIVVWAVLGELLTLIVFLEELHVRGDVLGRGTIIALQVALLAVAVLAAAYAWITLSRTVNDTVSLRHQLDALVKMMKATDAAYKDLLASQNEDGVIPKEAIEAARKKLDDAREPLKPLTEISATLVDGTTVSVSSIMAEVANKLASNSALNRLETAQAKMADVLTALQKTIAGDKDKPPEPSLAQTIVIMSNALKAAPPTDEKVPTQEEIDALLARIRSMLEPATGEAPDAPTVGALELLRERAVRVPLERALRVPPERPQRAPVSAEGVMLDYVAQTPLPVAQKVYLP